MNIIIYSIYAFGMLLMVIGLYFIFIKRHVDKHIEATEQTSPDKTNKASSKLIYYLSMAIAVAAMSFILLSK